ncbi:hypothetical protein C1H46_029335 [Malus baccata]|uniref:Uncharacterized protein n=1 Tax=Malus baccata TaxID=106549 RepID=A0A540LEZ8_MALBA|nr:hypothetical protein C1H46_029335 [Malus baccata]
MYLLFFILLSGEVSFVTPLMDGMFVVFQHTVKPGSYVWKFHRPPPRRPPPRRSDIAPMDVIFHMFEHLEELDDYIFEDLENEDLNSWERESLMQMACIPRWLFGGSSTASSWK